MVFECLGRSIPSRLGGFVVFRVLLLLLIVIAAAPAPVSAQEAEPLVTPRAMLYFDGRPLIELRGVSALPAEERVRLLHDRLVAAAEDPPSIRGR
jgi:hypothetical protein